MPPILINRAPWNALVDDSGNNMDGTPWNKAAIKSVLLDPIDVALADADDGTTKDAAQDTTIAAHTAQLGLLNTGVWTPYTPVWQGADGIGPVLGNGILIGRYALFGKTCHFVLNLKPGTTTTFGTSSYWTWTVPLPIQATIGANGIVAVTVSPAGSPSAAGAGWAVTATALYVVAPGGGLINPTVPFTWGPTNNQLLIRGTYEVS